MDYKRRERGFTLVEVIVTITILGVVTLVALPVITGLKSQFDTYKFKVYQSSLESAGKLFVDSNLEDVFGNEDSGCAQISYTSLVEKRLLEDISIDGVTCFNGQTFVRARKTESKIEYETSLYCTQNGNEVYSNLLDSADSCENEMGQGPTITISPNKSLDKSYQTNTATIIIKDNSGLLENQKLKYEWRKDSVDGSLIEEKELNVSLARGKIEHKIPVDTPSNKTDIYYLVVTPIDVKDINGNQTTQVVSKGPFKLDNTAPDIVVKAYYYDGTNKKGDVLTEKKNSNISFTTWSIDGYYFDFSGSSDEFSSITSEKWEWNHTGKVTLDTDLTSSSTANSVKNHPISAAGIRYAKYTVYDEAGNERSINITVYISPVYYISYAKGNGTGTISDTTCYYGKDCTLTTSKYTRTGYRFSRWKINDRFYDPGATVKDLTSVNEETVTAIAVWKANTYKIKYSGNGSTDGSVSDTSCTYGSDCTLANNGFSKTGYKFTKWKIGNTEYSAGGTVTNLTSTNGGEVTATAQWTILTYTVSYNNNGGSGSPSNQTKTYGTDLTLSSTKPTRSGWDFAGWGTSTKDHSVDYAAGAKYTSNANITLYAIWKKTITVTFNKNKCGWISSTSKTCSYYQDQTECSITSPDISAISGKNKDGTSYSDWLKVRGWNTDKNATSSNFDKETSKKFSSNKTYYAIATLDSSYTNRKWLVISDNGLVVRQQPDWDRTGTMHKDTYCKNHGANDWVYRSNQAPDNPLWLRVTQIRGKVDKCGTGDGTGEDDNCDGWSSARYIRPV